ncbi:uncharacterized protein B0P05DRAFT_598167 [Gilbertella persicaria]|uniref:uncharacterized protein n=1 Tax=Gilbertella persicaria TaxID=101096 RepID=UPI00221F410B|nr:uncharacterized protein B0P05DRAFT_598167 [Gilbertella persicaria]KAI8072183.1 hypothetical protein B0P05DRAFT_598167 [Gilbertella persicaria]
MHIEIAQAVDFLGRLLQSKVEQDIISRFKDMLTKLLVVRFQDHWDTHQPYRGNGFRALSNFNGQLDPILAQAAMNAHIQPNTIHVHLPRDFVLWIDPFSVSYRVGDHGNIMTLFEDRSRGRVTLKLDPAIVTSSLSPSIQPRTSTPIRISPPNSPDTIALLNKPQKKKDEKHKVILAN